jgi:hypothetical protein
MAAATPISMNFDTIPEIDETGLDGDPKVWFVVYLEGATGGWRKIEAANVADIV